MHKFKCTINCTCECFVRKQIISPHTGRQIDYNQYLPRTLPASLQLYLHILPLALSPPESLSLIYSGHHKKWQSQNDPRFFSYLQSASWTMTKAKWTQSYFHLFTACIMNNFSFLLWDVCESFVIRDYHHTQINL